MNQDDVQARACREKACTFADTGLCMEGLEPEECPHLRSDDDVAEDHDSEPLPVEPSDPGGRYFFGDPVPLDSAHEIAASYDTKLIVLLGEKDSGKTTLLAELHNLFLIGPVGELLFAGSITLPEFEKRCFLARTASGMDRADTERTKFSADETRLLHLCVASTSPRVDHHHLLIADLSGERSRLVRESAEEAESLRPLLHRADAIVLTLDGDAVTAPATKHTTKARRRALVQGLLEVGALRDDANVLHVVTKLDVVRSRKADPAVQAACDEMASMFGDKILSLSHFRTSARVEHGDELQPGHGLADVLKAWVHAARRLPQLSARTQPLAERSFANYRFAPGSACRREPAR
ncbi:MAG: hypothetical protein SangKO_078810 [Sandaracinaceae bacterium]